MHHVAIYHTPLIVLLVYVCVCVCAQKCKPVDVFHGAQLPFWGQESGCVFGAIQCVQNTGKEASSPYHALVPVDKKSCFSFSRWKAQRTAAYLLHICPLEVERLIDICKPSIAGCYTKSLNCTECITVTGITACSPHQLHQVTNHWKWGLLFMG